MLRDLGALPLTVVARKAYEEALAAFPTAVRAGCGVRTLGFSDNSE